MKFITRTVWILALVSLLTDVASEMLYPIMPMYLKGIGFPIIMMGVLEGLAEAITGLSKVYFGRFSDRVGRRLPFVQLGYALSALSKPFIAFLSQPYWIFSMRSLDRLGKGMRSAPRDALLAEESGREHRATVFGFHRSMDTLGAVLGPLLALIYLYLNPEAYESIFFIAFLPGILAIIISLGLRERQKLNKKKVKSRSFFSFIRYWKRSTSSYKQALIGLMWFALFNSSDIFLLLRAHDCGLSDTTVIGVYILYNLVYALFAFPLGILADRLGLKTVYLIGIALFSLVYFGLAYAESPQTVWILFGIYGLYAAATEGIGKAWISIASQGKDTGTALGAFATFQSLAALLAALVTGWLWTTQGYVIALLFSALGAFSAFLYLLFVPRMHKTKS